MTAKQFVAALSLIFIASTAYGLEFSYSRKNPFTGSSEKGPNSEGLLLRGDIVEGDYSRLVTFIQKDTARFNSALGINIGSLGGDVQEALKIAQLVKGTYTRITVGPAIGPCASACFLIVAASPERNVQSGLLGLHRPYVAPSRLKELSPSEAEALQDKALAQTRLYLQQLAVPSNLIDIMFQNASTEVHWMTFHEIQDELGFRAPWYEQYLIAKCGLDKAMEQRYFATNDASLLPRINAVSRCGFLSTRDEASSFLNALP